MRSLGARPVTRTKLSFFFFNDTATTEIYTLSLHDALPIFGAEPADARHADREVRLLVLGELLDRKSTRLNSSHSQISYAVFCLKKKNGMTNLDAPNGCGTTSRTRNPHAF